MSARPTDIATCESRLQRALDQLSSWSKGCNLTLNPKKTKVVLFSTAQMARVHCLDDYCPNLSVDGQLIERAETTRFLGTDLHQNLNWKNDSDSKITSCYSTISVLKKLKHLAPFQFKAVGGVTHPDPNRLQRCCHLPSQRTPPQATPKSAVSARRLRAEQICEYKRCSEIGLAVHP